MAIRQTKYIDITSGVGASNAVTEREMIGRVFTMNDLCGYGHVYEFENSDAVGEYFGTSSIEYKFAAKYFGFVSKSITKAKRISFARWTNTTLNPYIESIVAADQTISKYTASNKKLTINLGAESHDVTVTFSSPSSLSAVATSIQSAINNYQAGTVTSYPLASASIAWNSGSTSATVSGDSGSSTRATNLQTHLRSELSGISGFSSITATYNSSANTYTISGATASTFITYAQQVEEAIRSYDETTTGTRIFSGATVTIANSKFKITLPNTITDEILYPTVNTTTSSQDDLATLMGVASGQSPVLSNIASSSESPVDACTRVDAISDNFGSFCFIGSTVPNKTQAREIATWNLNKNYKYLYVVGRQGYTAADGTLTGDVLDWADSTSGVGGIVGTALWSYKVADDYVESLPMALFASTDYNRYNSTKTFMYQQNSLIQSAITNDKTANLLDDENVNYIGTTQSAGTLISFSQDGNNADGTETSVYCNEVWMKAKFWTDIMNLFLMVEKVPANDTGTGMIKTVMLETINTAVSNGTITPRKTLTSAQKAYIDQITGVTDSWKTVYENGYTLAVSIEQDGNRYIAKYLFVYLKGDAIRKVEGSDILI